MKRLIAASLLALSLAACQQQAEEPAAAAPEAKPGLSASNGVLIRLMAKRVATLNACMMLSLE